jgi:hypothetical protein
MPATSAAGDLKVAATFPGRQASGKVKAPAQGRGFQVYPLKAVSCQANMPGFAYF